MHVKIQEKSYACITKCMVILASAKTGSDNFDVKERPVFHILEGDEDKIKVEANRPMTTREICRIRPHETKARHLGSKYVPDLRKEGRKTLLSIEIDPGEIVTQKKLRGSLLG
ncbi:hypothetical protein K0M31_019735 [Melipona bicolor]|uniref:Uncharacterized protein n=1 Tax=Melipona bicolor TaxID=60889 RepID=A0AA40KRF3_9HYME|nr:hypothetical protein K0M31_019735 [Melipona bicolor]